MTEKTDVQATETEKKAPKVIKLKKTNTQETFKSKRGNEYIFMFTNTQKMQQLLDSTYRPDGVHSELLMTVAMLKNVLEGNEYDFDYFDKKIANKDKTEEIAVEDEEGNQTDYKFKFPGLLSYYQIMENATGADGITRESLIYDGLMKDVISPKTDWKYWDTHAGYAEVMTSAREFVDDVFGNSELAEVMQAAAGFVNRKFQ